jgi:hypothetical protein
MQCCLPVFLVVVVIFTVLPTPVASADGGITITTQFQGTPQHGAPVILNSGTVTLTLTGASALDALDHGQMTIRNESGSAYKLPNTWMQTGAETWQWVQYIPDGVAELTIDTNEPISWMDFGPWATNPQRNGVLLTEKATQIQIFIGNPLYRDWEGLYDPTWDWTLEATPATAWAASQWPWWSEIVIKLDTSCNGKANNHGGVFSWQSDGTYTGITFGNGVYRSWLREPLSEVIWRVSAGNWEQNGVTHGPTCWTNKINFPIVAR